MKPAIIINRDDGSIEIEGCATKIVRGLSKEDAVHAFARFYVDSLDHKNGYEWLTFKDVSLGGRLCGFSLGLHDGIVEQVHFGVELPGVEMEDGWPTRETMDREIAFVRKQFGKQLDCSFDSGHVQFPWGVVWSIFDPKGYMASAGLRYINNQ